MRKRCVRMYLDYPGESRPVTFDDVPLAGGIRRLVGRWYDGTWAILHSDYGSSSLLSEALPVLAFETILGY